MAIGLIADAMPLRSASLIRYLPVLFVREQKICHVRI